MKKMLKTLAVIVAGFFTVSATAAIKKDNKASFSGTVLPGSLVIDSIRIVFQKEYLFNTIDDYAIVKTIIPDTDGNFCFEFLFNQKAGKISQMMFYNKEDKFALGQYLVEPDDDIQLKVKLVSGKINLNFAGTGDSKYNCRREVEVLHDLLFEKFVAKRHVFYANGTVNEHIYNDRINQLSAVIESYRKKITPLAFGVLKADMRHRILVPMVVAYKDCYARSKNIKDQKAIAKLFLTNFKTGDIFDSEIYRYSYNYIEYILKNIQTWVYFNGGSSVFTILDVCKFIENNYKDELRERLLTQVIVNPMFKLYEMKETWPEYEESIKKANQLVKNPLMKQEITRKENTSVRGAKVFDFNLPDQNGNFVQLSNFKGKVVMLDVWFTGCVPCMEFAQRMKKEVYFKYKQRTDFEVVSISIDRTKDKWIKSINEGKYTTADHVNLYTNGLMDQDPFLKYYEVRGLPFLLLVDKQGRIYSRLTNSTASVEIDQLIAGALQAN